MKMKGHTHVDERSKLLTCQTWVTEWNWFDYAQRYREQVPFLLVDRSPCTDPFFDPYASSEEERRPIISGLCRCIKNFRQGDTYIYITRVNHKVCQALGIATENMTATYLGIAAHLIAPRMISGGNKSRFITGARGSITCALRNVTCDT